MKKKMIPALIAAGAVLMTGCSSESGTPQQPDSSSGTKPPVAYMETAPEGKEDYFKIGYDEWHNEYSYQLLRGSYTEEDNADVASEYRSNTIEYLMNERIMLYLAEQEGITAQSLTEEEMNTIDSDVQTTLKGWYDSFIVDAKNALGEEYTDEELLAKEKELFAEFLGKAGLTEEVFTDWSIKEVLTQKFIDKASEDVDDKAVSDFVQKTIDTAKDKYENDLKTFEDAYTAFYVPEGTRVVQQICVLIDKNTASEVTAYRNDGDDEKADAILNEALERVRFRIDEAYEKLQNGEDWAEIQEEYNDDTNGTGAQYIVYPRSNYVDKKIIDAAMAIPEKGGISDIITTDSGFFLLYYVDDRVMSDSELQSLNEQALEYLKDREATETINEFKEQYPYTLDYDLLEISEPEETTAEETSAEE